MLGYLSHMKEIKYGFVFHYSAVDSGLENNLLSPIYTTTTRGGCWFCPNQTINQLRYLYHNYPDYWEIMLKWDADSPKTFKSNGITIRDYDTRFKLEDKNEVPMDKKFRWSMINK